MERRKFIVKAGGMLVAAGVAAAVEAPNVIAQPKYQWRLATSWSSALEILLGNARRFAKEVEAMSGGRLKIDVFAAGELIPAFGVFDAVSQATLEGYHSAAYFWAGKEPASQWFTAVPFGLNAQGMTTWYLEGGGLKLWEETYAPFNLVPRPAGSTGVQMGGWFRKKINTMADLNGLKFRIPGLGGKVYAKAGTTVVLTPPGEIFPALERGVIDGTELSGPHDDMKQGLHHVARYYYYPGWHESGATTELVFNKKAYESLPSDLRRVLDAATMLASQRVLAEYESKNSLALHKLRTEYRDKVEVVQFPIEVVRGMKRLAAGVVKEESEKSPMARKVYDSYTKFQAQLSPWAEVSEAAYQNLVRG